MYIGEITIAVVFSFNTNEDIDFFVEPEKAVDSRISNHPAIKEAQAYTLQAKQSATKAKLKAEFPDYEGTLQDPKFAEWINQSNIRIQLLRHAHESSDYDSAHEIFSLWREKNDVVKSTAQMEQIGRKNAIRAASTGSVQGTQKINNKRKYRRSDVIKLIRDEPETYKARSAEFLQAYAEGRVI